MIMAPCAPQRDEDDTDSILLRSGDTAVCLQRRVKIFPAIVHNRVSLAILCRRSCSQVFPRSQLPPPPPPRRHLPPPLPRYSFTDKVTFTSVVAAGSRSGKVSQAETLLDQMRREGVPPNTATYNAAIMGCSGGGEWRRALGLLEKMRAESRDEARPESLSYTLAIKACARDGRWETALELLEDMQVRIESSVILLCLGLRRNTAYARNGWSVMRASVCGHVVWWVWMHLLFLKVKVPSTR